MRAKFYFLGLPWYDMGMKMSDILHGKQQPLRSSVHWPCDKPVKLLLYASHCVGYKEYGDGVLPTRKEGGPIFL